MWLGALVMVVVWSVTVVTDASLWCIERNIDSKWRANDAMELVRDMTVLLYFRFSYI